MGSIGQGKLKGARAYQKQNLAERNELIHRYSGLVKRVALHVKSRLPPKVELDDLVQSGMLGLIDAIQNYKPDNLASFEVYAMIRIRGAIIDNMRLYDWTPRSVHQNTRAIQATKLKLSQTLGRDPTAIEMAEALGVTVERYQQMVDDTAQSQIKCMCETSFGDESMEDGLINDVFTSNIDSRDYIFDAIASGELRKDLAKAISQLPEREQSVIALYYDQEMNLKEIGLILGLSESRVCQLISSSQEMMRDYLSAIWISASRHKGQTIPDCIGIDPEILAAKKQANLTIPGAVPTKKPKTHSDLFADIEEQHKQIAEELHQEKIKRFSDKFKIEGVDYDKDRFFKSYKDERYKDTLSQRFIEGELELPDVSYERKCNWYEEDKDTPFSFVHSSRPHLQLKKLSASRAAAKKW